MTQTVFTLLIGWLTDGTGPIAGAGANEGLIGEGGSGEKRGREMIVKAINERCRIQGKSWKLRLFLISCGLIEFLLLLSLL